MARQFRRWRISRRLRQASLADSAQGPLWVNAQVRHKMCGINLGFVALINSHGVTYATNYAPVVWDLG